MNWRKSGIRSSSADSVMPESIGLDSVKCYFFHLVVSMIYLYQQGVYDGYDGIWILEEQLLMKKLLILYGVLAVLWLIIYFMLILNSYVSIKYEIETIANNAIVANVYQLFDVGVVLNIVWFVVSTFLFFFVYLKSRKNHR